MERADVSPSRAKDTRYFREREREREREGERGREGERDRKINAIIEYTAE